VISELEQKRVGTVLGEGHATRADVLGQASSQFHETIHRSDSARRVIVPALIPDSRGRQDRPWRDGEVL
jgi:hypothetical protein